MDSSKAYWIYWGACFATVITWVFAVSAAADDAWVSSDGNNGLELGNDCVYPGSICERYNAATAFQFMATIIVSIALVVVFIAAFTPPPTTGTLGLAVGVMLAVFSFFQMIAFSLMASLVDEFNKNSFLDFEAGPTLGVAVMAWLFGIAGTITILVLRSSVTSEQEGPFRKCRGDTAGGGSAGHNIGTV